MNTAELMKYVNDTLTKEQITAVQELYERDQWLIELEANTAMTLLSAAEIKDLFQEACVADW